MKRLWAPWRSKLLKAPPRGCIFCSKPRSRRDRENYVLKRSRRTFCMLNLYPYNNGHLMVAPYRHVGRLAKLTAAEMEEMMSEAGDMVEKLERLLKPDGFNIGMNVGPHSGAAFAGHLHVHVVPRWKNDTNFMPILAGNKVVSQSLDELYGELAGRRRGK